jgi:heat shock protein HslJ
VPNRLLAVVLLSCALAGCVPRGGSADSGSPRDTPVGTRRIALPLRARGNEPGWSLEIGEREMTLVADYGERRVVAPTPAPSTSGDTTRWSTSAQGHEVLVSVVDRLCFDGMSGFAFPRAAMVRLDDRELRGCGGESVDVLVGPAWAVREIDGTPVAEGSRPTLIFGVDGRLSGRASCNQFGGDYTLRGDELAFSRLNATRMRCAAEVMQLEQRFLARLGTVRRFELRPDTTLILSGEDGRTIVARR